jgi:hypothetical protein
MDRQVRIASGLNALLAFWLMGAPVTFNYLNRPFEAWGELIVGAIVIVFAVIRLLRPAHWIWMSWTNAALGAWLIFSPFVLVQSPAYLPLILLNDMVVGLGFVIFGAWSAIATRSANR